MGLYTGKGDSGETQLGDRRCVRKNDPRVMAYGDVDELNALLGLCGEPDLFRDPISTIQRDLFAIGAELSCSTGGAVIDEASCRRLETWIDDASRKTDPIRAFILPGGCSLACRLHHARTVCRRAERSVIAQDTVEPVRPAIVIYLNRLSDLLFAWARLANRQAGLEDTTWKPDCDH